MITNMSKNSYEQLDKINKKLKEKPDDYNLLMDKALIYFQGYDDKNTIQTYKKIIELYPQKIQPYFWLSYYIFRTACDPEESIKIAKKGLSIDPNNAGLHSVLAWALDFKGYADKKEDYLYHLNKAIELDPSWTSAYISIIEYSIVNKEYNTAKKNIVEALKNMDINCFKSENGYEKLYNEIKRNCSSYTKNWLKNLLYEMMNKLSK
jgi:tetratricopeptide (TPR) repeat protein